MIGEASLYGIYVPWLMVLAIAALFVCWGIRRMLAALGVYRWIWHAALFDTAVYVLVLFVLTGLSGSWTSFP